jgi:Family of unknown function (DUF6150)
MANPLRKFNYTALFLLWALTAARPASHSLARVHPCDVFGVIHISKDPYLAQFRVYVETEADYRADVIVFKEDNQLYADRQGIWFVTDKRGFATYTVAYVTDRSQADFIVYFTEKENFAGCNRR